MVFVQGKKRAIRPFFILYIVPEILLKLWGLQYMLGHYVWIVKGLSIGINELEALVF